MKKRLTRSRKNRVIGGVLGGLAEYFDTDPVLVRVIFIAVLCLSGFFPAVIAYLLAWIIMPEEPLHEHADTRVA